MRIFYALFRCKPKIRERKKSEVDKKSQDQQFIWYTVFNQQYALEWEMRARRSTHNPRGEGERVSNVRYCSTLSTVDCVTWVWRRRRKKKICIFPSFVVTPRWLVFFYVNLMRSAPNEGKQIPITTTFVPVCLREKHFTAKVFFYYGNFHFTAFKHCVVVFEWTVENDLPLEAANL